MTWGLDSNSDGLPDDWQALYFASAAATSARAKADPDGDGVNNYQEFLAGTDPNNAASVFRCRIARTGPALSFQWVSVPGYVYQVQAAPSAAAPVWQNLGPTVYAADALMSVTVNSSNSGFYRVMRVVR
jgi:hypothetical protein